MKNIFYFILFIVPFLGNAQKLDKESRKYLKHRLDSMIKEDQKYRWQIAFREFDQSIIDSLKKLPHQEMFQRINSANAGLIGFNSRAKDSLQNLQDNIYSLNYFFFVDIIKEYGYPSYKRTRSYASNTLRLHYVNANQFKELSPIYRMELDKGNLSSEEFASWYDSCLIRLRKKQMYGEFEKKYPCVLNIKETNIERIKIGLKPLKENNCRN